MMKYEKPVVELVSFQTEETMKSWDLTLSLDNGDELLGTAALSTHTFGTV